MPMASTSSKSIGAGKPAFTGAARSASEQQLQHLLRSARLLVVDADAAVAGQIARALPQGGPAIVSAATVAEASRLLEQDDAFDLVVLDTKVDADITTVPAMLRQIQPGVRCVMMSRSLDAIEAIESFRAGALDYLVKPLEPKTLQKRLAHAIGKQWLDVKNARRLVRLREAVRQLNQARRLVSQKVDLLCNDFVDSYADLAKQVEQVRLREHLSKLLAETEDVEQMLCHVMDWLLRNIGHCNIAIFITSEEGGSELGAYMKYTVAGEDPIVDFLASRMLPKVVNQPGDPAGGCGAIARISPGEMAQLVADGSPEVCVMNSQEALVIDCPYLAESLGTIVIFRESAAGFSEADEAALRVAGPLFAEAVTRLVGHEEGEDDDDRDEADWWKRGDDAPF